MRGRLQFAARRLGLPIGLMIYARPFREDLALLVAYSYEQVADRSDSDRAAVVRGVVKSGASGLQSPVPRAPVTPAKRQREVRGTSHRQ